MEQDWSKASLTRRLPLALEGTFYTLAYTLALRGEEVPLVEIGGIIKHWDMGLNHETPHVVITLLGRFKNEVGESHHLMPVLCEAPAGLQPQLWVERVLWEYASQGITRGYMF